MRCYALLALLLIPFAASSATTYVVSPDGTGDFPTIQAAIDAAVNGDTIELTDGTFTGEGDCEIAFRGKAITVRSQSGLPDNCVIDAGDSPNDIPGGFYFTHGEGPDAVIEGITIINGHSLDGGAIYCDWASSPSVIDCIFRNNHAYMNGGAIDCMHDSNPMITACLFEGNSAELYGGGGLFAHESSPIVTRCTFLGNVASCGGGAFLWFSSAAFINCTFYGNRSYDCYFSDAIFLTETFSPTLSNTIIAFHEHGQPIHCSNASAPALACCDIFGNGDGDWVGCVADQYGMNGNICEDPLFCDPVMGNFSLHEDSPCAPFSAQNPKCDLVGAWPVGCEDPGDVVESSGAAPGFSLSVIWPTPAMGSVRVSYAVPQGNGETPIILSIHDLLGRRVRTLIDARADPGVHWVEWDGRDERGTALPAGTYFCHLSRGDEKLTRRVMVMR